jgi:hypothetical protein
MPPPPNFILYNTFSPELRIISGFPADTKVQTYFYSKSFENKRGRLTNVLWRIGHREAKAVKICLYRISWEKPVLYNVYLSMPLKLVSF